MVVSQQTRQIYLFDSVLYLSHPFKLFPVHSGQHGIEFFTIEEMIFKEGKFTVEVANSRQFERQVSDILNSRLYHLLIVVSNNPLEKQFKRSD